MPWREVCNRCGRTWPLGSGPWRCQCGGALDLAGGPVVDLSANAGTPSDSIWRYGGSLPQLPGSEAWRKVTLGEARSPLVPIRPGLWAKWEGDQPTGSFKARGAAVMMALAADLDVGIVVSDSSGNAGLAVAAFAQHAGLSAEIFVPADTSPGKVETIESYGARVVRVEGGRQAAAEAAVERLAHGGWYASHVWRPAFHHGIKTMAFELFEQLGGRGPATVVVPTGNGTLVLGLWLGFNELVASGRLAAVPRLIGVQSERCAPLAGIRPGPDQATAAVGVAVARPPRAAQVRAAIVASGGRVLIAREEDLIPARAGLAELGFVDVGVTSSVVWAALDRGESVPGDNTVVVLSGR